MAEVLTVEFKGIDHFSGVAKGVGSGFSKLGGIIKTAGIAGVAGLSALGVGAGVVGGKLLNLGSDAQETGSLLEASLGKSVIGFNKDLRALADETNRSFFEMQTGSSTIIAMTKAMGASESQAADLGIGFSGMAADLGSFFNRADSDVFLDIQSALGGSSETLQKYGVIANETTLKQMALEQGLIATKTDALDPLMRSQLLFQAITEQSADAMGDAARTSDSWSNSLKGIKARIADAATAAGTKLLPVMQPLLTLVGDLASQAIPMLSDAFERLLPYITKGVDFIRNFVTALQGGDSPLSAFVARIADVFTAIRDHVIVVGQAVLSAWRGDWSGIVDVLRSFWGLISPILTSLYTSIRAWFTGIDWEFYGRLIVTQITKAISTIWAKVSPKLQEWRDNVKEWFGGVDWKALGTDIIDKVTDGIAKLWGIVSPVLSEWWDNVEAWFDTTDWEALGATAINGIWEGISKLWTLIEPTLNKWWDDLVNWYEETDWEMLGFNAGNLIIDGLSTLWGWAKQADWADISLSIIKGIAIGLFGFASVLHSALKDILNGMVASVIGEIINGGGSGGGGGYNGFADGGFTGTGGRNEVAGVVHRGEFVLNRDAVNQIGLSPLNAMNNGGGNNSSRNQTINQNTNIYTSSVDTAGESRAMRRFATGGI